MGGGEVFMRQRKKISMKKYDHKNKEAKSVYKNSKRNDEKEEKFFRFFFGRNERQKLKLKMEFHVSFHNLMFQFKMKTTREKKKSQKLGNK